MPILSALDTLLQSRPPAPEGAALISGALIVLAVWRLICTPPIYFAARRAKGGEVWWALLTVVSPAIAIPLFSMKGRVRPAPVTATWNPWVQCPYCGTPRGFSTLPCPRCGQPLPPMPLPPPLAPPPQPPAKPAPARPGEVGYGHVIGSILLVVALATVAGLVMVAPLISDLSTAPAELAALSEAPWFVLATIIVQDSIMIAIAYDQTVGRGRVTRAQLGFTFKTPRLSVPQHLGIGLGAGVLLFAFTALSAQMTFDLLRSFGMQQSSEPLPGQPVIHSPGDYLFWVVAGVLIAPLAEETFFRGYALGGLASRGLENRGLLFTSVLFAAVHFNPLFFPQLMVVGFVLGGLYLRTGSLAAPIVAHMTNNLIVTTAILLGY